MKTFQTTIKIGMNLLEAQQQWLNQINDEMRQDALQHKDMVQQQRARCMTNSSERSSFRKGIGPCCSILSSKTSKGS